MSLDLDELRKLAVGEVLVAEPMAPHTSFRIGGPSLAMVFPTTIAEIRALMQWSQEKDVPVLVLGRGSNVLCPDEGLQAVVLNMSRLGPEPMFDHDEVVAGAGVAMSRLARLAVQHGYTGLEFAAGIPGTFGGVLTMNAGAHGGEIAHVVHSVTVLTSDLQVETWTKSQLGYRYRHSALQRPGMVALAGTLHLERGDLEAARAKLKLYLEQRRAKQPLSRPNCGSVFTNPPGGSAGALIESVGGKGRIVGDAQISDLHANFIINRGNARARDVLSLIEWAQNEVYRVYGITLEPEVRILTPTIER